METFSSIRPQIQALGLLLGCKARPSSNSAPRSYPPASAKPTEKPVSNSQMSISHLILAHKIISE